MRANYFAILTRAVEEGVEHGWARAHKHTSEPDGGEVMCAIVDAVMLEICEVFDFGVAAAERGGFDA